ncbi:MerR family transcriptional regulator [Micromonospora sp. NPDC126480]|uniref:MerR family transcriptional regulator n=1 Tax=Micromonospora sp. NPDC126480 TaxID=3155312 RepID=UPI00332067C3
MRIGELAARTGASVRSIRYYEKQNLLGATRSHGGQRIFDEEAVERVALIRRLLDAGLTSRTMAELLPCITDAAVRTPYLALRLHEERQRILDQIERLGRTVAALDAVIGDFGGGDGGNLAVRRRGRRPVRLRRRTPAT